jgi:hypothetical protein
MNAASQREPLLPGLVPGLVAAAAYLAAITVVMALGAPDAGLVVIPLLLLSLGAGLAVARRHWIALPIAFFAVLEFTPWDYGFDGLAALAAVTGILSGTVLRGSLSPNETQQASDTTVRRHQDAGRTGLLRRLISRRALDNRIDLLRLRLDSYPNGRYQPIDALPGKNIKRADGSLSRWGVIRPVVEKLGVRTGVDVGANEGYFSIQLGSMGITTVALEPAPPNYRTALLAVRLTELDNVGVLAFGVNPDTVELVPHADATVFLSLWHHLVKIQGLQTATDITARLWKGTGKVMFFDTGEDEMDESFDLPEMTPDPRTWIAAYLAETCPGSEVRHLGVHAAFDAEGNPCERNLFAVVRTAQPSV